MITSFHAFGWVWKCKSWFWEQIDMRLGIITELGFHCQKCNYFAVSIDYVAVMWLWSQLGTILSRKLKILQWLEALRQWQWGRCGRSEKRRQVTVLRACSWFCLYSRIIPGSSWVNTCSARYQTRMHATLHSIASTSSASFVPIVN